MATTLGIDVSIWQDNNSTPQMMDFAKAKAAGAKFVFIKASQAGYLDQDYVKNWMNAENVLPRGAYHFYDWRISYQLQIDLFCQLINNDPGELPPVLDYEMTTNAPAKATAYPICLRFLRDVQQRTGITPLLYTSPGYWASYGANVAAFAEFPLWIANYQVARPSVPAPWTSWKFWQYGVFPRGREFGAESASIDLDYFNGTEEEFRVWAGLQAPAPSIEERLAACEDQLAACEDQLAEHERRIQALESMYHIYLPVINK